MKSKQLFIIALSYAARVNGCREMVQDVKGWLLSDWAGIQRTNKRHRREPKEAQSGKSPALIYLSNKLWCQAKLQKKGETLNSCSITLPDTSTLPVISQRGEILKDLLSVPNCGSGVRRSGMEIQVAALLHHTKTIILRSCAFVWMSLIT